MIRKRRPKRGMASIQTGRKYSILCETFSNKVTSPWQRQQATSLPTKTGSNALGRAPVAAAAAAEAAAPASGATMGQWNKQILWWGGRNQWRLAKCTFFQLSLAWQIGSILDQTTNQETTGPTWCKKRQSGTTITGGWAGGKRNAMAGQAPWPTERRSIQ